MFIGRPCAWILSPRYLGKSMDGTCAEEIVNRIYYRGSVLKISFIYLCCKNILSNLHLFILTSGGLCSARGLSLDTSILLPPSPRTLSALWTLLQFSPSLPASDIYSVNIYSALTVHRDLELGNVSSYLFTVCMDSPLQTLLIESFLRMEYKKVALQ